MNTPNQNRTAQNDLANKQSDRDRAAKDRVQQKPAGQQQSQNRMQEDKR